MAGENEVNPHYLEHVIATGLTREVEVSEDIYAHNGMKLLAKGARVNGDTRDRLLEHKLLKPLEDCLEITGGVTTEALADTAEQLLDDSKALRALYVSDDKPVRRLRELALASQSRSLLTVFADHNEKKLDHAVLTSLLGMGVARKLGRDDDAQQKVQCVAGLLHDVGELYIDPKYLQRGASLEPTEWRHVAAHPVIAHRLLKDIPEVGKAVSDAVLSHHERLDGFGYPRRLRGTQIPLDSQILATAEILVGLFEASATPELHAAVAVKLVPGEFDPRIIGVVSGLAAQRAHEGIPAEALSPLDRTLGSLERICAFVRQIHALREDAVAEMTAASPDARAFIESALNRFDAICRALASTGLDDATADKVLPGLESDDALRLEVTLIVREIRWRLRELERELKMRLAAAGPDGMPLMQRIIDRLTEQRRPAGAGAPA